MTLKFNEKTHRYWLDGKPIGGVTTLIKGGLPAPQLTYWAARTVAEYVADNGPHVEQLREMGRSPMVAALKETPWARRDQAAIRGTEVHTYAEALVANEPVEVPDHILGYVEACARFLDAWQPKPLVVEKPVAHRAHWWAGTPDLIAEMPDGRVALLDWKTGKGIYSEVALQLAAYAHGEFFAPSEDEEVPLPAIEWAAAVHLSPTGYEVVPVKADDDAYKAFRHVAHVAQTAKRMKSENWVGEPLTEPTGDAA